MAEPTPDTRLQQLRDQLAGELAKARAADLAVAERPDRDDLLITPHNGIASGLETAVYLIDCHLREAGGVARTTPDNSAASGDGPDNPLRSRLAAALQRAAHRIAGRHIYLSTGCLHGDHGYCQGMTGLAGAKRPGECKHCRARCICQCHRG